EYITIKNRNPLIKENVYNDKGKVSKEQYIDIEPIKKYTPVLINEQKGYGLKSIQDMRHPSTKELIGTIETLWYFNKDKSKRSEEHTSELKSRFDIVCRLLLEKKKIKKK